MRIAIATFQTRISPRFDCANTVWLVDLEGENEVARTELSLMQTPPPARAALLRSHDVAVLLCGGVRRCDYFDLLDQGIEVIAGLMGEAQDMLTAYRQGRLNPEPRWEPGRRFGCHARRGRHAHGAPRGRGPMGNR
ncbi:MAG TPA: NifB/NifX family molybdenum-iron cluster-binding protein [bacterium]|nr:NifB/NifX family molybdenum-iron cluster-binding protein [bacterium]